MHLCYHDKVSNVAENKVQFASKSLITMVTGCENLIVKRSMATKVSIMQCWIVLLVSTKIMETGFYQYLFFRQTFRIFCHLQISVFPKFKCFINLRRGTHREEAKYSITATGVPKCLHVFLWKWDLHNTIDLNSYPTSFAYFVNRILISFFAILFFQCEKRGFELDRCCDTFVSFWQHLDVPSHLTQFAPRSFWLFSHLNSH